MTGDFYSRCKESYEIVHQYLNDSLPWGNIPPEKSDYKFQQSLRLAIKPKIIKTISTLKTTLTNYSLDQIAISYNGGKDCLVMLILFLSTIYEMSITKSDTELAPNFKLDSIYINSESPFPELSQFIEESTKYYHLNPIIIKLSLKAGFEQYLTLNPKIKAIVVGIRYTDPYGADLECHQPTDHNWPHFMRVHPILHWNYIDIWDFILGCNLTYCHMYDLGYTSLGGVNNTLPNPYLKVDEGYLPAYMLTNEADERERLGRENRP